MHGTRYSAYQNYVPITDRLSDLAASVDRQDTKFRGVKLQYTYQKRTHFEVLVCTTYMNWIIVGHFPDLHKTEKTRFMISGSILHIRLRQRGIGLCCDVTAQGSE